MSKTSEGPLHSEYGKDHGEEGFNSSKSEGRSGASGFATPNGIDIVTAKRRIRRLLLKDSNINVLEKDKNIKSQKLLSFCLKKIFEDDGRKK